MAVTTLDAKTALIVIDLQKGILSYPVAHAFEGVVANAAALAAAARRHGLPVVLVNVDGGAPGRTEQPRRSRTSSPDFAELLPALNRQPEDIVVTKKTWGVFASTNLEARLRALEVTQCIFAGVATTAGVESSARQAYEAGFNVTLAIDAMSDMSLEAHENAITRIFPRLGETGTSAEIIALLDQRPDAK